MGRLWPSLVVPLVFSKLLRLPKPVVPLLLPSAWERGRVEEMGSFLVLLTGVREDALIRKTLNPEWRGPK